MVNQRLQQHSQRKATVTRPYRPARKRNTQRNKKSGTTGESRTDTDGLFRLTSVFRLQNRRRGKKFETDWVATGHQIEPSTSRSVNLRIINPKQYPNVDTALPGALISVRGRVRFFDGSEEIHVIECSMISNGTVIDDYRPVRRVTGEWRWGGYDTPVDRAPFSAARPLT